jgi:hypothetical protein
MNTNSQQLVRPSSFEYLRAAWVRASLILAFLDFTRPFPRRLLDYSRSVQPGAAYLMFLERLRLK